MRVVGSMHVRLASSMHCMQLVTRGSCPSSTAVGCMHARAHTFSPLNLFSRTLDARPHLAAALVVVGGGAFALTTVDAGFSDFMRTAAVKVRPDLQLKNGVQHFSCCSS